MATGINDKLNITLHVFDTNMSVKIDRADEEVYRKAAALITEVVGSYTSVYKGLKSEKDILYMALIDIALRYEREGVRNDIVPFSEMLAKLSGEIEEALK